MSLHVRVSFIVFTLLGSAVASADPYVFFQINNGAWSINETHAVSGYKACQDTLHAPFDATLLRQVVGVRYEPVSGTCRMFLDDNSQASIVATQGNGSCPSDIAFSFENQRCLDDVSPDHVYAVLLALFVWTTLIGGLLFGFRLGQ